MPSCSVIIGIYKNVKASHVILEAYTKQSFAAFDIIIAKDNNNELTKQFTTQAFAKYALNLIPIS